MLDPMAGALGFIDRGTWAAVRRSRELGGSHGGRLVLLDPGRTGGFDDLWGLIFASPSKPQHPEEIGVSVARNTSSVLLLSQWAAHGDCKRDARRSRIVREALARARDATKAAE
jgi:hypothetical protein